MSYKIIGIIAGTMAYLVVGLAYLLIMFAAWTTLAYQVIDPLPFAFIWLIASRLIAMENEHPWYTLQTQKKETSHD